MTTAITLINTIPIYFQNHIATYYWAFTHLKSIWNRLLLQKRLLSSKTWPPFLSQKLLALSKLKISKGDVILVKCYFLMNSNKVIKASSYSWIKHIIKKINLYFFNSSYTLLAKQKQAPIYYSFYTSNRQYLLINLQWLLLSTIQYLNF